MGGAAGAVTGRDGDDSASRRASHSPGEFRSFSPGRPHFRTSAPASRARPQNGTGAGTDADRLLHQKTVGVEGSSALATRAGRAKRLRRVLGREARVEHRAARTLHGQVVQVSPTATSVGRGSREHAHPLGGGPVMNAESAEVDEALQSHAERFCDFSGRSRPREARGTLLTGDPGTAPSDRAPSGPVPIANDTLGRRHGITEEGPFLTALAAAPVRRCSTGSPSVPTPPPGFSGVRNGAERERIRGR
jgi:hypothetical protein